MKGMSVVRVKLLFSFDYNGKMDPCTLVDWFKHVGASPDSETGMWKVRPEMYRNGQHIVSILHLDTFLHSAHLLPIFGQDVLPFNFHFSYSLDAFESYYVNKYAHCRSSFSQDFLLILHCNSTWLACSNNLELGFSAKIGLGWD